MAELGSAHTAPAAPHGQKRWQHGAEMHGRRPPQPGAKAAGWKRRGAPLDSGKRSTRRKGQFAQVLVPRPDATGDAGAAILTADGMAPGARAKSKAAPPSGARRRNMPGALPTGAAPKSRAAPPPPSRRRRDMPGALPAGAAPKAMPKSAAASSNRRNNMAGAVAHSGARPKSAANPLKTRAKSKAAPKHEKRDRRRKQKGAAD